MRKTILSICISSIMLIAGKVDVHGRQNETIQEFKVLGNCNACKKRIEKGALSIDGVSKASWDKQTKIIKVTMAGQTPISDVSKAIAAAGHDTQFDKAETAAYDGLPGCCQYDRENNDTAVAAVVKTMTFKVAGNCGMCKKKIEKAARGVDGVVLADWDKEKKLISLGFANDGVSSAEVSKAIAAVGYDTEFDQAGQGDYNQLPDCCQYERLSYQKD